MSDFDAIVIGSGAGGGAAAYALARAGMRVLVLEKGPHHRSEDFTHDELTTCRRPFFLPSALHDPNVVALDGAAPARSLDGWTSVCVGGGTVHMSGYFFRLRPEELRAWPLAPGALDPYYDEVERTIGVSGPPPWPLPPLAQHPAAKRLDDAAARLGLPLTQTARAILSRPLGDRPACHYCGFCGSYGCEVGAKSSSLASFLPLAAATGRLALRANATVTAIERDARGRASAVVFRDGKHTRRARARVIVLAASAIQSARLWLLSGLPDTSRQVGRNLIFSASAQGHGTFPLPHPDFAPPGARDVPFLDRTLADPRGTILFGLPHENPIFQAERAAGGAWGRELTRRLRACFREERRIEVESFVACAPNDTRVTLDPRVVDAGGQPVARLDVRVPDESAAAAKALVTAGLALLDAAGAARTATRPDAPPVYWFLQAGTLRMGDVVGADGQALEVPNLYVADASTFPSAGAAPFTLTIMANALRIAAGIAERAKRAELYYDRRP